jgi:hypothetical protein
MQLALFTVTLCIAAVNAHLAAWHKGMYCLDGTSGKVDLNAYEATTPLYNLPKSQWWFHHVNGCDNFPPKDGDFLELPAGKDFTVEISANRATTSLAYNGKYTSDWVDGESHPDNFAKSTGCITQPNIHTTNESMAAGTAFAISYQSDISKVTEENLVVFTVRYHTPWKRLTSYSVPAALPACPPGGCICAWGWVPNGCGEPNMYHQAFKCKVTGATSKTPVAVGKPPVWCEGEPSKCTKGAKQMIYWNQAEGNNIKVSGNDRAGMPKSPAYNDKLGFPDGAQNDIFAGPASSSGPISGSGPDSGSGSGSSSAPQPTVPSKPPTGPSDVPTPPSPSPSAPAPSEPATGGGSATCPPKRPKKKGSTSSKKKRAAAAQHRRRRIQTW